MVSRDFQALSARRAARARLLTTRYPASGELLSFYAALASFQERMLPQAADWERLLTFRVPLMELVRHSGPKLLQQVTGELDEATCRKAITDYWRRLDTTSPLSFFARVLLQPYAATTEIPLLGAGAVKKSEGADVAVFSLKRGPSPRWGEGKVDIRVNSLAPIRGEGGRRPGEGAISRGSQFLHTFGDSGLGPVVEGENCCPRCGHPPQVGALRAEGEGSALTLVCSLCLHEWPFRRGRCVACGEEADKKLAYYTASGFDHLRVQACDTCRLYLHTVDVGKDAAAIPDVDELVALPLDVWAQEHGYQKLQPNLAGI